MSMEVYSASRRQDVVRYFYKLGGLLIWNNIFKRRISIITKNDNRHVWLFPF